MNAVIGKRLFLAGLLLAVVAGVLAKRGRVEADVASRTPPVSHAACIEANGAAAALANCASEAPSATSLLPGKVDASVAVQNP